LAELGQIRPWCSIGVDGSLSPDSFRAQWIAVTEESGHEPTSRPLPGTDRQCSFIRELPAGRAEVSAATKDALAKSLKKDLSLIVERRNKIHRGDLERSIPRTPRPVTRGDVSFVVGFIEDLVRTTEKIV
jgi:hypothetical protein